jgi:dihydroxyacid dehydratase/phosphogluconate dehydratase
MLYRNLLAMEAEELMRANPLDGVVLLSGCDKTTPGLLMAAASVDLPAVMVTGGPCSPASTGAPRPARPCSVALAEETGSATGTAATAAAHHAQTPLHLAFPAT